MAQVPLLVSLQPAQLSQLAAKMSSEHHDAGATIFSSVCQSPNISRLHALFVSCRPFAGACFG